VDVYRPKKGRDSPAAVRDDSVQRRFIADSADRLWCTDITGHPTGDGSWYLPAVEDVCTR